MAASCAVWITTARSLNTDKNLWFLGRAIWVYSFLYNHFGNNPEYLEVARKTKEFVFKYALQKDGWWAEELSREGKVLRPFSGDTEGMYHLAEGLQEYAAASGDDQSREAAFAILKKLFRDFDSPAFPLPGSGFPLSVGQQARRAAPGVVVSESHDRHPDARAGERSGNRRDRGPLRGRDHESGITTPTSA